MTKLHNGYNSVQPFTIIVIKITMEKIAGVLSLEELKCYKI